jgi:ribosomal protein S18 acetylase RimI-like enzyme
LTLSACDYLRVLGSKFTVRPAEDRDRVASAVLFATVAKERDGIATEPPVDIGGSAAAWNLEGCFVADANDELIGTVVVFMSRHGYGEIGMHIARPWQACGVGSALLNTAIEWAREQGLHKLSLNVFSHNEAAIALYRNFGFSEEGRRIQQYRRASGELWDTIEMGLLL